MIDQEGIDKQNLLTSDVDVNLNKSDNTSALTSTDQLLMSGPSDNLRNSINEGEDQKPVAERERLSQLGRTDRIMLTWEGVNFSVPLSGGDRLALKKQQAQRSTSRSSSYAGLDKTTMLAEASKSAQEVKITLDPESPDRKMVVQNSRGYAAPGQMLSIMGASGCGKTSLLSILAQRTAFNKNCRLEGSVSANGQVLPPRCFGNFGAFVMQDDILIETMTPRESFKFAAKLRTNMTDEEIDFKVEQIIARLNLGACANSRIGGFSLKSLSGGERKRTSIGYELITDPKVLLLDEPTSGLDSTTALRIIKLLKKEADAGMTVAATIHQPSGDIFTAFDRLLLLHNGQQIYQGRISQVKKYLGSLNLDYNKLGNPADYLIKMCQAPMICRDDLTLEELVNVYDSTLRETVNKEALEKSQTYSEVVTDFEALGAERQVSCCRQFSMLFVRNWHYLLRNPRTLSGIAFNGVFTGLLQLALYWNAADPNNPDDYDPVTGAFIVQRYVYNLNGLAFLLANNYQFGPVSSVTLQMPMQVPVFKREVMNKMYGPSVNLWARYSSNAILFMCYPISLTLVIFWGIGLQDTSFLNFITFLGYSMLMNALSMSLGYFAGVASENDQVAQSLSTFFILFWMLLSGGLGNLSALPTFVQWLSYTSPQRYMCEGIFRALTNGLPKQDQEAALEALDYTLGNAVCLSVLAGILLFWISLAWFTIWFKNRDV